MGSRGPIGYKALLGRAVDRPGTSGVPREHRTDIVAPAGLDVAGLTEWQRVTGLLHERGALDGLDQTALHDYITCWQRLREAEAEISVHGIMIDGANGLRVKNPAVSVSRAYRAAMVVWTKEFGLTVSSRERIGLQKPKPKILNKFEKLEEESRDFRAGVN